MAATFSHAAMEEAAAALQTSQAYQASRGEKLLNRIGMWLLKPPSRHNPDFIPAGDRALAVSGSQAVSVANNAMATAAFSVVKDHVSSFVERSQTVMNVLDQVGKVHPFIQSMSKLFLHEARLSGRPFIYILQLLYLCSAQPSRWN